MDTRAAIALASLAAAAALAGCGGGDDTGEAVEQPPSETEVIATVEGVEDGEITGEDLEREVVATASAEGGSAPAPASPEFDLIAGDALDRLVLSIWIRGEAAEQGGEVSEEDAIVFAEQMDAASAEELAATWGMRTECEAELVSRLCGDGGEGRLEPPPDIPPASGLEKPPD